MLSCKDVTRLVSESLERRIRVRERMGLMMHLGMCPLCRLFSKHIKLLHGICRKIDELAERNPEALPQLSDPTRQRMKETVDKSLS